MVIEDDSYPPRKPEAAPLETTSPATAAASSGVSSGALTLEERLASPLDRLASNVADFVLLSPLVALFIAPLRRSASEALLQDANDQWLVAMSCAFAVAIVVTVAYQTLFLLKWRATPGKRLFGLTVESLWQDEGDRISLQSALLRSLIWCFEASLLGFAWIAVIGNERRRPFHDRIADTIVLSKSRSKVGPPGPSEISLASGLTGAFFTSLLLVTTAKVSQLRVSSGTDGANAASSSTADSCDVVDRAQASWVAGLGEQKPTRTSIAIALYEADGLSESCLKQVAERELWQTSQKDLAYLARGLAEKSNDEMAQEYFDKACDGKSETDVCKALVFLNREDLPKDPVEAKAAKAERENDLLSLIGSLKTNSEPFLRILAIRELNNRRQNLEALTMIDSMAPQKELAFFLSSERMKTLWALGRKEEARVSLRAAVSGYDSEQRVAASRWLCQAETSDLGCSSEAKLSCDLLSASIEHDRILLGDPDVAVTYIRNETCAGRADLAKLKEDLTDVTSVEYVSALEQKAKGATAQALAKFQKIAGGPPGPFSFEAQAQLIDLATNEKQLTDLREHWAESDPMADGWTYVGRRLMSRYNSLKAFEKAIEVGFKMGDNEALDPQAAKEMVIAAYRSGQVKMAAGYYQNFFGSEIDRDERRPASNDSFAQVVLELKADVRGRR